ncbi:MAG: NAD(+)/NADH kinase [Candidatus Omnitrophota bacterium]
MRIQKILLLYKRSAYRNYFLNPLSSLYDKQKRFPARDMRGFRLLHEEHYLTLKRIEQCLAEEKVDYVKHYRGQDFRYSSFDLVITVGGDGTFLEAARNVKRQIILGVNSVPGTSIGRFCFADRGNFPAMLRKILANRFKAARIKRLRLQIDGRQPAINILNDALVCHKNPAAMSRYYLMIGRVKEEQRSSGVWIATAAGSSGAIHSSGGRALPMTSARYQYRPRELYDGGRLRYRLRGGVMLPSQKIRIISLMREGMVFVDGEHARFPLTYGSHLEISPSGEPLLMAIA